MSPGSYAWELVARWIRQGMPYGLETDPTIQSIESVPAMREKNFRSQQQLAVIAHYSDGSTRDVTRLASYEANHFFGRGIVDPEDDMRVTNPPSNPELLDGLTKHFLEHHFDLKDLVRTICKSNVDQLNSEPTEFNKSDQQNYSSFYPRRLSAEVNLSQSLHLLNSGDVEGRLQNGNGRAARFTREKDRPDAQKIRELYLAAFAREPRPEESEFILTRIAEYQNKQQAWEDVVWAILNAREFQFVK